MRPILVTGIAGFVMSHCAERLIEIGRSVVGVDNLSGGVEENVPKGAHFIKGDICDEDRMEQVFRHFNPSVVLHGAAFASENLSVNCGLHTARSIITGTQTLINAAVNHGVSLFVNTSSIAVYGDIHKPPFTEEMNPLPMDNYGCCKLAAEGLLRSAKHHFGLNYITWRPHNCIGIRQSLSDQSRNVASIFIRQALQGIPLTIYGSGEQTRSWSPISYVSSVMAASLSREHCYNKTYNIGGARVMTVMDLALMILDLTGSDSRIHFLPERKEAKHAHSDHRFIERDFPDLHTEEQESISHCLAGMIEEARRNPLPPLQKLPKIEIEKNLPKIWKSLN